MQPTKFIDHDEFDKLTKEMGNVIEAYRLTNIPFDPALWDDPKELVTVRILFLNVHEPVLYRDREKTGFIISPVHGELDFNTVRDMHTKKDARVFRLAIYGWNRRESDLDEVEFFFKEDDSKDIPPFKLGQIGSH